ncbi:hypothetical protein AURANDRAFT_12856, partial [Aureococcus anophagefferens]
LRDEVRVLSTLRHPHIVEMREVFETPTELYIIMERARGGELFDRIVEKGNFSEAEAAAVMYQLLSALTDMHRRGVIHRDIKPENLLLTTRDGWELKLSDFGLRSIAERFGRARTHTLCGSPYYMAPEVCSRERYGPAVDVWSAGVVLYILLTGSPPWERPPLFGASPRIDVDGELGSISRDGVDLLLSMLRGQPGDRCTAQDALRHPWIN